jgi:hypothetical protein
MTQTLTPSTAQRAGDGHRETRAMTEGRSRAHRSPTLELQGASRPGPPVRWPTLQRAAVDGVWMAIASFLELAR